MNKKKGEYSEEEKIRQAELAKARFTDSERFRCLENLTETSQELSLIHCGIERCHPLHIWQGTRSEYIIHFVLRGHGVYSVGGHTYSLEAKQMFLIRPDTRITYIADEEDPWSYCWIGFRGDRSERILADIGFRQGIDILDTPELDGILADIRTLMEHHTLAPSDGLYRKAGLFHIFAQLSEYRRELLPVKESEKKTSRTKEYVTDAISYIRSHYADQLGVSELADELGISRAYLNRAFNQELGMSAQKFLIDFRMHNAAKLLLNSSMSVQQVSLAVGYQDQLTFSKAFRRKFGVSPSGYRQPSGDVHIYHERQPDPPSMRTEQDDMSLKAQSEKEKEHQQQ